MLQETQTVFFELETTIIFYLLEMLYLMGSSALPQEQET